LGLEVLKMLRQMQVHNRGIEKILTIQLSWETKLFKVKSVLSQIVLTKLTLPQNISSHYELLFKRA
jgi:hypothetical protein